jgi:microsomal epoxide hydrolase
VFRSLVFLLLTALSLVAAPWKEGYIRTSDGVRLHYLTAGTGPSIVLQPGWAMPAEIWEPQIRALSKTFRVVAIDPRSQGKSGRTSDGLYPNRRAQDIREVIDKLRLAPAVLVGWSLGATEVMAYVDQFGTAGLRGIVLVDGVVGREVSLATVATYRSWMEEVQTKRAESTTEFVRDMYKTPQSDAYLKKITAAALRVPTSSAVLLLLNAYVIGKDLRPALARIDKPLLYVATPAMKSQVEMLRETMPAARIEMFENAGHALFVDEAGRFNKLLAEFAAPRS